MRMLYSAFCVVGFLATVGFATPLSRQKRGVGAYAGGYTGVGSFPFPGTFAAAGFNPFWPAFNPFFRPAVPPFQFMNVPVFDPTSFIRNWYDGDNVCKQEKTIDADVPGDLYEWLKDMPNMKFDSSHEQESCQGTNTKYACVKRIYSNDGKMKMKATKYECCHGFVRPSNGDIGCVESFNSSDASKGTAYYQYYPVNGQSASSRSSSSSSFSSSNSNPPANVDKVPIQ